MVQASRVWTTYVLLPANTHFRRRRVVGYSLMVQASRVSVIFVILAVVVRIYSALTNGAGIARLDNIRAAAGQHALSTTRVVGYSLMVQASRVSVIFVILAAVVRIYSARTNGAGIMRLDNIRVAAGQHALSTTRVVGYSLMVQFRDSAIPRFRDSAVSHFPGMRDSAISRVRNFAISQFRDFAIPRFHPVSGGAVSREHPRCSIEAHR